MTYSEISTMLKSLNIPTAYFAFPDATGQEPPFICFYYPNSNDFIADNKNYQKVEHLVIELYTDNKDFALEKAVEDLLNTNGCVYTRAETYIDSERMYEVIFETDVLITFEENNSNE